MSDVLSTIKAGKVIAIVRGISSSDIVNLATAIKKGGINCIEITLDQSSEKGIEDSLKGIKTLSSIEGICVGAGTVMTVQQVHQAVEAGAEYIISPNVDEEVIKETKKLGKVSIPGAMTPTEVAFAYKCGADIVKLFPAGVLGVSYIKALRAPLKHIPMTAVGSVNPANCKSFIDVGCIGIGVGGNLVSKALVEAGKFDEITAVAQEYVKALEG